MPSDYDLWLHCAICGLLVSVNNIKHQSTITENIEVENPNTNTPHFEAITDKREKSGVGITRCKNRTTIKDKDKEIQDLIDKYGIDRVTVHQ